jgi:predicted kinase
VIEIVVIAGPAGVGKTTVANELSVQLRGDGVRHAVVDTDALDDIFPVPEDQWRLTERHLAFVWQSSRELGISRLILTGVYLHDPKELAWITRATTPDRVTLIRLDASEDTLVRRVRGREIGSAYADQLVRTRQQAVDLRTTVDQRAIVSRTDERSVVEIAFEIRSALDWH